jgi:hypothetical protein
LTLPRFQKYSHFQTSPKKAAQVKRRKSSKADNISFSCSCSESSIYSDRVAAAAAAAAAVIVLAAAAVGEEDYTHVS